MTHKTNGRFPWQRDQKMKAAYFRDLDAMLFDNYSVRPVDNR